jgi:lipoprotein-anchoring transpeptidase ErfK/SrfK
MEIVCLAMMTPGIPGLPSIHSIFGPRQRAPWRAGRRASWRAGRRAGRVLLLLAAATLPTAVTVQPAVAARQAAAPPKAMPPPKAEAGAAGPLSAPPPQPGPVGSLVVELAKQRITAFDRNRKMLYRQLVSTGLPASPTPKGDFYVKTKYKKTRMTGRDFQIPVVENVMCLGGDGLPPDSICVHPAPWQEAAGQAFGVRRSHGCIRTSSATARWLFGHTDVGTPVTIQN